MELKELLQRAGCVSDRVASFCPRNIVTETSVLPIPLDFQSEFEKTVAAAEGDDPQNPHAAEYVSIGDLTNGQRLSVMGWLKDRDPRQPSAVGECPEILYGHWATMYYA